MSQGLLAYRRLSEEMKSGRRYSTGTLAAFLDEDADTVYYELKRLEQAGQVRSEYDPLAVDGEAWLMTEEVGDDG